MDPYTSYTPLMAHHHMPDSSGPVKLPSLSKPSAAATSGNGKMKFRALYTSDYLPEEARKFLVTAHGGFGADHRPGQGETYFALPGGGIIQISADLRSVKLVPAPEEVKTANLHSTAVWYAADGSAFLAFASNNHVKIFTTTLDGRLVATLDAPTPEHQFDHPEVNDYFLGRGNFAPTGVDQLEGRYYVTTSYSNLDYVPTASILCIEPFLVEWSDLVFGGKGTAPGQVGTPYANTVPPGRGRLDVSDRPNSRIERFTPESRFRSMLKMPAGSLPCDTDYLDE